MVLLTSKWKQRNYLQVRKNNRDKWKRGGDGIVIFRYPSFVYALQGKHQSLGIKNSVFPSDILGIRTFCI
jgi:hypothetical protein